MTLISKVRLSKRIKVVGCISVILFGWFLFEQYAEDILCADGERIIECAYRHPSVQYIDEYQSYPVLDQAFNQLHDNPCKDIDFLTATLAVGISYVPLHAHYSEEITETVDQILVSNPECFLRSVAQMKKAVRKKFSYPLSYIANSREHYQSAGIEALKKFLDHPEYREVISEMADAP